MCSLPLGVQEGKGEMLQEANEAESEEKRCQRLRNLLHFLLTASLPSKIPYSKTKIIPEMSKVKYSYLKLSTAGKDFVFFPNTFSSPLLLILQREVVFGKTVIHNYL